MRWSRSASSDRAAYEQGLAHADDAVRQGTIRCLAWIAPPAAASTWSAPLIHDPSPEVRAEAVAAIGRLGDEDAAMLLFELLGDESELIQESAMGALSRLPPETRGAAAAAGAAAATRRRVRIRAAETLGLLRDPQTAPALLELSRDPREAVRRAALKALGEMDAAGVRRAPARRAARREQPGAPAGRALAGQAAATRRPRPSCCRCSRTPTRACASSPCARWARCATRTRCRRVLPFLADAARSCASRRWRRWAPCAP